MWVNVRPRNAHETNPPASGFSLTHSISPPSGIHTEIRWRGAGVVPRKGTMFPYSGFPVKGLWASSATEDRECNGFNDALL